MHEPSPSVGEWLQKVTLGYYQYHAVPGNLNRLQLFRHRLRRLWRRVLVRRSQTGPDALGAAHPLLDRWIPVPRVLHPYPENASPPGIQGKSRMRKCARTDLCGGRSAMVVPTATVDCGGPASWVSVR